jgi:hypothetical protein
MVQPPRGGPSGNGEIALSLFQAYLVYLTCPACGEPIRQPFSRSSGLIPFVHQSVRRRHLKPCRLLICPDREGERHDVAVVADGTRIEVAYVQAMLARKAA